MMVRSVTVAAVFLLVILVGGVVYLNSSTATCGLVGCPGWCTSFAQAGCGGPPPGLPGPGIYGTEQYR